MKHLLLLRPRNALNTACIHSNRYSTKKSAHQQNPSTPFKSYIDWCTMPPKSNAHKKDSLDADSEDSNSNNSVSSKPTNNKQPRMRPGDISASTTNEPSSASATDVAVGARHPRTLHVAAAAVPRSEKKPRRAGFREQFLQKVRETSITPHHMLVSIQI